MYMRAKLRRIPPAYRVLLTIMIASFMNPLAGSALTLSLPSIGVQYGAGPNALSWVLEIYLLTSIVCLLPMGKVADRWGKRRTFFSGALVFAVTSIAAIFTPSLGWLLAFRGLQGIGAAMIFATNMSIISLVFPPEQRGLAMGWNVSMVYTGLAAGPVLGGLLNYYLGWQSIFCLLAMLATACAIATQLFMRQDWLTAKPSATDYPGALLYGAALLLAMFGLSECVNLNWAWVCLRAGIVLFACFVRHELRTTDAILPVRLLVTNREFSLSSLTAMLNYCATFATSFLLSVYLQSILGLSSREAGLIMLVQPVFMAILSPLAGRLSDKHAPALLVSIGMGVIACGLLGFALAVHTRTLWGLLPVLVLVGIGFALFAAPNNNAIMSSLPPRYYSLGSAMLGTVRQGGQVLSMATVTLLLSFDWQLATPTANLQRNIELAFILFTLLCLLGILPSSSRQKKAGSD